MSEPQKPKEENYDLDAPSTSGFENPWRARTLGREAFYLGAVNGDKSETMKKDGEARCFVIRRPQSRNLYGGVQFWLQVGLRNDLSVIQAPFYSAARLNEGWTYPGKKDGKPTGKSVLGTQYGPVDTCALARLVKKHFNLIAPLKFKGEIQYWPPNKKTGAPGEMKRDYKKLFAMEIYEVLFEYAEVPDLSKPGQTKRVVVVDPITKKPKYTVNPKPYIWELNESWWEQFRNKILNPAFGKATEVLIADIDGESSKKPLKPLPTTDLSKLVLKLWAKTDEKDPSRASYEVDFSAGLTIDTSAIVPVEGLPTNANDAIDWEKIYPPMTQEQADKIIAKAAGEEAAMMGEQAPTPQEAPGGHEEASQGAGSDDDIPF